MFDFWLSSCKIRVRTSLDVFATVDSNGNISFDKPVTDIDFTDLQEILKAAKVAKKAGAAADKAVELERPIG